MSGSLFDTGHHAGFLTSAKAWTRATVVGWLHRDWIYIVMLFGAFAGIAYTSTGGPVVTGFGPRIIYVWMVLVPLFWLVCVIDGWRETATRSERTRLVVLQLLHWFAVIGAMYVALRPEVRGVVNDNSTGLLMLTVLTLGTFLAGVHAWSPAICIVGVFLGAAIPAIAWLEQSVLLLVAGLVVLLLVLASWAVWHWRTRRAAA